MTKETSSLEFHKVKVESRRINHQQDQDERETKMYEMGKKNFTHKQHKSYFPL
jgi:hypothetical protein